MLVLDLTTMGLGTCWVGSQQPNVTISLTETERIACTIVFGYTKQHKSLKEHMLHQLSHWRNKPIHELYTHANNLPHWFLKGIKAVQKAPSSMNKQPVIFHYHKNSNVTANVTTQDKQSGIDLGIAKAHFELGAERGFWTWGENSVFKQGSDDE